MKLIRKKKPKTIPTFYHAAITIRAYDEMLPVFVPAISKKCSTTAFVKDLNNGTQETLVLMNDDLNEKPFKSILWMDKFKTADEAFYSLHKVLNFSHDNIADLIEQIPTEEPVCPHCQNGENHNHGEAIEEVKTEKILN